MLRIQCRLMPCDRSPFIATTLAITNVRTKISQSNAGGSAECVIRRLCAVVKNSRYLSAMIEFKEFSLENGLRVIVHEDPTVQIAVLNILYDVGSRDEHPDKTGVCAPF